MNLRLYLYQYINEREDMPNGLLLWMNDGCITTNPNQSMIELNPMETLFFTFVQKIQYLSLHLERLGLHIVFLHYLLRF